MLSKGPVAGVLAVFALVAIGTAAAAAGDVAGPGPADAGNGSWIAWHTDDFFDACDGNCGVAVFGGDQVKTQMADILFNRPSLPWDWKWGHSQIVGGTLSRRLATIWNRLDIEPEVGVAQRVGALHQEEVWAALYFRWTEFPWNGYVRTTFALSTGLNYANLSGSKSTPLLHYFAPEMTFALPEQPQYEILVRFHHRSAIWTVKQVDKGWQYLTAGLRYRF